MKNYILGGGTPASQKPSNKINSGLKSLALMPVLIFTVNCSTPLKDVEDVVTTSQPVHVAFAGGGWRAHTGHSGWVMSALAENTKNCPFNNQSCLGKVFANVETISSNSGGSWFNTMLAYSDKFDADITRKDAFNLWADSRYEGAFGGWLGKQEALFDAASIICEDLTEGAAFLGCVAHHYDPNYIKGSLNWDYLVDDLVFHDYDIPTSVTLDGQNRQSWAADKTLLMAGTLLTNDVVLNDNGSDDEEQYYQICFGGNYPVMNGDGGGNCNGAKWPDVLPVTFSSLPYQNKKLTAPDFFKKKDSYVFGYSSAYVSNGTKEYAKIFSGGIKSNHVPVIKAAAASSAAAGFSASHKVLGDGKYDWYEAYNANDLALGFGLNSKGVDFVDSKTVSNMSLTELKTNNVFKVADGGAVDNSAVAQLVSYLQLNNQANGFNIVAFDNVMKRYEPKDPTQPQPNADVGVDIASLFLGQPNNEMCMDGVCVKTPKLKIFDATNFASTDHTWNMKYHHQDDYQIIYTQYKVTPVENADFQITANGSGTLHAFTVIWNGADTAPQNDKHDADFKAYAAMLDYMENALQWSDTPNGPTGRQHLSKALGLTP